MGTKNNMYQGLNRSLLVMVFLLLFLVPTYAQQSGNPDKKISLALVTGGELSFLQQQFNGGANHGVFINTSLYHRLFDKWNAGLGIDLFFGQVINNRAIHFTIRREFNSSFIYSKLGANQAFVTQSHTTNTEFRPRHYLALGYGYRLNKILFSGELLHKRFMVNTNSATETFINSIDAIGIRIGIGWEL